MKRRDYNGFIVDVLRFRPLVVVILSAAVLLPSFVQVVTQGLSLVAVLLRFAEAVAFVGFLVWLASAVVIHYARIQARSGSAVRSDDDVRL